MLTPEMQPRRIQLCRTNADRLVDMVPIGNWKS